MLMELGLSKKFHRIALHDRKSALGIGLMEPSTIIDVFELKLFIGNTRKGGNVENSMQCQLEHQVVEAGRNMKLGENPKLGNWHKPQFDEINDLLWKRVVALKGEENERKMMSENKTLLKHVTYYFQKKNNDLEMLKQIKFVRLKKKT